MTIEEIAHLVYTDNVQASPYLLAILGEGSQGIGYLIRRHPFFLPR